MEAVGYSMPEVALEYWEKPHDPRRGHSRLGPSDYA